MDYSFTQDELVEYEVFNEALNMLLSIRLKLYRENLCDFSEIQDVKKIRDETSIRDASFVFEKVKIKIKECEEVLGG